MNNKGIIFILSFTNVLLGVLGLLGTLFAYRLGYCKSFDERVGASECKPSRKWM